MVTTVKAAQEIARISNGNTKMPGSTFAQDSFACNVGSRLAKVENSVCSKCYARRIQAHRPSVNTGWKANLEKARKWLSVNPDQWVAACVFQIKRMADKSGENYHRWFDSGDLDSLDQLIAIARVAEQTPDIKHWLPTREIGLVMEYMRKGHKRPDNLVIRVSSPMIDDAPLSYFLNTSTVHTKNATNYVASHVCPASQQGNSCGWGKKACRACWDVNVRNVSYPKH